MDMAKTTAKSKKTAQKKAPSAAQLAARKAFAEMAKQRAGGNSGKSASKKTTRKKAKKSVAKAEREPKIPTTRIKPISKPAFSENTFVERKRDKPVVKYSLKKDWSAIAPDVWM